MAPPPEPLHASFLCSLALALLRAGRLSAASHVASALSANAASPPAALLRRLIPALASSGLAAAAARFRPVPGDPLTLNSVLLSHCALRSLRPALSLLRSSQAVDTVSYNIVILGISEQGVRHGGGSRLAPALLAEMCKRGVPFDSVTVNATLVGLCRDGQVEGAAALAEMMVRGGGISELDAVGWNALIDGYCKLGDMVAALAAAERTRTDRKSVV